ncbi:hypothetical protein THARTR1_08880 [Trichoderma harzianum]|uniref:RBR-type E3 ubiquitin transferase n=1 Tax=Trichoderma harzianum TaxID=5544 RepID=A0A2K0TY90_TRIHA|nr:hypothetical protein THARTR1_08880 [Trichoderma harzianum]
MLNPHNRRPPPVLDREPEKSPALEQLHPVLLNVVERMGVIPPKRRASITEADLARAVSQAISMLPDDEQSYIISRFMTDDEIAEERLQSPQVQDLGQLIHLSANEVRILLRSSPEPEDDQDEVEDEDRCIVCFSRSDFSLPCGCRYCVRCHRENIRVGLRSELDYPTGCCNRPFNEATVRLARCPALVHLFRQLSAQYSVHPGERLYCHDPGCSSFIPAWAIQPAARDEDNATPVGICLSCRKATCAACGSRTHRGLPCREEEDDEALLDMIDSQGLVSCPECGVVIALRDGCNHMRCLCGAEFCYICGRRWTEQCTCPEYNGFHLRVPVRQRPGRRPILRGGRAHLVGDTDVTPRIPRLRYDPEDEVALAAVDYAPVDASVPTAVPSPAPSPAPNRVQERVVRHNEAEHMEIPLHMDVPRPPRHQQHAPAVRPIVFNGGPIGLRLTTAFPSFLHGPPLPIPGAFPSAFPNPFPFPPFIHHPIPNHAVDHRFNGWHPELHAPADVGMGVFEDSIKRLDIGEDMPRNQWEADRRQNAMAIREFERQMHQARGPNFVQHGVAHFVQGHEEPQGGEHRRRRRQRGR